MIISILLLALSEPTNFNSVEGSIEVETGEDGPAVCSRITFTAEDVMDAIPGLDHQTNEPVILIILSEFGREKWQTSQVGCLDSKIAIYIGDELISAAVLREYISGAEVQLMGNFSIEDTETIASRLRSQQQAKNVDVGTEAHPN